MSQALEPIAIVGWSGRFPGAPDVDELWRRLLAGEECLTTFTRDELIASGVDPELVSRPEYVPVAGLVEDADCFDAAFFGYSPREAEIMDPQQRLFLEQAWVALEHAGHVPRGWKGRIGVFAGAGLNLYLTHQLLPDPELVERAGAYPIAIGNDKDFLATRVSYKLDLRGPSVSVQTACSTSLVAVCMACQSLADGESDLALAGGVAVRVPLRAGYRFQEDGILSPDGHCRAFDASARGTVPGSGVGVVVLRRLSDALRDGDHLHGLIRGWAVNNDGDRKVGFTAPSVEGQSEAILEALALAAVEPASIGYVEAHGTGTRLGDPMELASLARAFCSVPPGLPIYIGSIKSNVGHLDAAAGVTGLIKTALVLRDGDIPPTLHLVSPNPELRLEHTPFALCSRRVDWPREAAPRRAGVSSFGIGGTNAHVVLEQAPPSASTTPAASHALVLLSARTPDALEGRATALSDHLARHPDTALHDAAWTLQVGRDPMRHRLALVAESCEEARAALASENGTGTRRAEAPSEPPGVVFLFPGQGAQHAGMGRGLHAAQPVFRAAVDLCAERLSPHLGLDLRTLLFPEPTAGDEAQRRLERTELAQPALFTIGYALARQWMELGIRPAAMLGHSIGEYVAACVAGVLSLDDALALVAARGRLIQSVAGGAMDAVPLPVSELIPLLAEPLGLAAINGPALCTVSGPFDAMEALERELGRRSISWRRLHTSHAFHSGMMDRILDEFRGAVERTTLRPPELPYVSNLTGTWVTAADACSSEYWVHHLRSTVRFADGLAALAESPARVLLEAGPGRTLISLAQQHPALRDRERLGSLPHPQEGTSDAATFLGAAGRLWLAGADLEWRALHRGEGRRRVPLPTYPFARTRHWVNPPREERPARRVGRRPDPETWYAVPSWRRSAPLPAAEPCHVPPASWLVLANPGGLADALTARLGELGFELARLEMGGVFARLAPRAWAIDAESATDHERALRDLQADGFVPQGILHLWSLEERPSLEGAAGLLRAAQAFARVHPGADLTVMVVTSGVADLKAARRGPPEAAAAAALAQVLGQEVPGLSSRHVDVEDAGDCVGLVRQLASELCDTGARGRTVALRGGERWIAGFESFRSRRPPAAPLQQGAHALITGGLGRFGLALAEHLARTARARLTLVDRRSLSPRARWPVVADSGTEEGATVRRLLAIEALGSPVRVIACDVADEPGLAAEIAMASSAFGPVAVALHGAALSEEDAFRPLLETGPDHLRAALRPRLDGLRVLDAVLAGAPVACRVAASSLASVMGGVGLGAFAAADACVDAYAHLAGRGWTVVNWEVWGSLGPESDERLVGRQQAELMLTADELCATFERARAWPDVGRLVVATGDLETRLAQARKPAERRAAPARPVGAVQDSRLPQGELETRIAQVWREALGLEQVGADHDFFELGGNSLIGLQILSRLRAELAVELPLRSFFESRTVARMARVVEGERIAVEAGRGRMEEILAEIETLTDAEIDEALREPASAGGEES